MMKAVVMRAFGGPEVLRVEDVPMPEPGPGEALVRVHAVSVGRLLDLVARAGTHPFARIDLPHILGAEHAGVVADIGSGVDTVAVGERVAVFPVITCGHCDDCLAGHEEACPYLQLVGVQRQGAYAQYTVVPAANLHPIPDDVSFVEASALALSGPVAWLQLDAAGVEPGAWVLVQAAGSALGSLTAALALQWGARVIATSRKAWKRERLAAMGIAHVLDSEAPDFVERVLALTSGRGVGVAIDDIGSADLWAKTMAVLATRGVVVCSGAFVGGQVGIDLRAIYIRSQRILGIRTGNRASVVGLWGDVRAGLRPIIDRTFPLAEAASAHVYVERDANFGRVALVVT